MSWIAVIALALLAFTLAAFVFRLERGLWTSLLAALTFGLAGYALQASPDLPAAPRAAATAEGLAEVDMAEARREFVAGADRSSARLLIMADGLARRGRYAEASQLLAGITRANPRDFEAWLAQGIALVEHADGTLTPAALYAFRRADALAPANLAPGYFLGVSLIRQGRLMETRSIWQQTLANAPPDAAGREGLEVRLSRLEGLLGSMEGTPPPAPQPAGE